MTGDTPAPDHSVVRQPAGPDPDVVIPNKRGLHARAAAKFVMMAERFDSSVDVLRDGQSVSARSIMGLMMLGAGRVPRSNCAPKAGTRRRRSTRWRRWSSPASMNRTSPPPPQHKRLPRALPDSSRAETRFSGIPVSAGVAIGPVFRASEPTPEITRHKIAGRGQRRRRRPAGRRGRAVAQAAGQAARPTGRAAGGKPGGNCSADRRLHPHARPVAADPRRAAAHRGDAALGRNRRGGGNRGDRRGDPGPGRTRHAGRRPRRPARAAPRRCARSAGGWCAT